MKPTRLFAAAVATTVVVTVGLSSLFAQSRQQRTPPAKPEAQGKEITLTGKLVDLQCYMTGQYPTKNQVESTRKCIRAGVPAAVETSNGLVVVGMGHRGPARTLAKHGLSKVELTGRLYEKQGIKYIDVTSVKEAKPAQPELQEEEEETNWQWPDDDEPEEQPEPEEEE
jgi:hypothetical protein